MAYIDHKQGIRGALEGTNATYIALQFAQYPALPANFLLGHRLRQVLNLALLIVLQAVDGLLQGPEIGQQTAQPTLTDIGLTATLCLHTHHIPGRTLGTHEQHHRLAAIPTLQRRKPPHRPAVQQQGLLQIDDVNAIALAVQVGRHLRVPVAGLMAEMEPSLQHFTHAYLAHASVLGHFPLQLLRISGGRLPTAA